MTKEYYRKHRSEWRPGGKYYYYKPKQSYGKFTIKTGVFILSFD